MSRATWDTIKKSKTFYVNIYHWTGTLLIISLIINAILISSIYYVYMNRPATVFYSTNGITPPDRLQALDAPNDSSTALLAPDPVNDDMVRQIPQ